ncbi:uncharacterized protein EV420DRAFT_1480135 [Desarmillaria tabescens]|uniref:Uncharacterized protein n=1 Tax=Armillaria tabescens TaxID=1929756 RepID=A0AA39KB85_ARMTA|nr:uncharacterized protein EV420DRAFT_1480135 [Desarmillaria tabescens]KAK0457957.1 hypothetical protein EV420DRAFT_1480135 [Desarmillaria tabescens]
MAELENIGMKPANFIMTSFNPGTFAYTVARTVIIVLLLSAVLPPLTPRSAVKSLSKTVGDTMICYEKHKDMLDGSAGFSIEVKRLQNEVNTLKRRYLQVYDEASLTDLHSWKGCMVKAKDIWVKARRYQREAVKLRKRIKLAKFDARIHKVEATSEHHNWEGRGGQEHLKVK